LLSFFRSEKIKFSLLQGFFWSAWGSFASFYVLYFHDQGYSSTNIGIFLSVMTFMGLIGQLFWGYICDLKKTIKKVFIFCVISVALIVFLFPYYKNIYLIIIAMGGIGFLWTAQQSIIDSWILQGTENLRNNYGFTRAWGSAGFAVTAVLFGKLIENYSWDIMFKGYALITFLVVLTALIIKDGYQLENIYVDQNNGVGSLELMSLFKNFEYLYIVLISTMIFMTHTAMINFLPVILSSVGGGSKHQGFALFFIAMSDVPTLIFSKKFIIKYHYKKLLLVAAFFYFLRYTLLIFASSPEFIIVIGILQSLSFAVFLPVIRYPINQISPNKLKTTAQTFAACSYLGLGGIIANSFGGLIIDNFGIKKMLFSCIIIIIIVIILLISSIFKKEILTMNIFQH